MDRFKKYLQDNFQFSQKEWDTTKEFAVLNTIKPGLSNRLRKIKIFRLIILS
jgi:hypothetical protein